MYCFSFTATPPTTIYTLSLHDALPIYRRRLKANQTGKKFRVGIKSNISTNRNNLISGVNRCIHLSTPLIRRSEERFSRNAETDLVCRLLLEKKNRTKHLCGYLRNQP